jgi:hypothetical protein
MFENKACSAIAEAYEVLKIGSPTLGGIACSELDSETGFKTNITQLSDIIDRL